MKAYKIVRMFFSGRRPYTVATGVTLSEAQEHCRCPETSSSTCTLYAGRKRTDNYGPWFDGYEEIK